MLSPVARFLRFASTIICLILVASFALFAINETNSASAHQQQVLDGEQARSGPGSNANGANGANGAGKGTGSATASHKSSIRKALDEASSTLTSPFSDAVAGSNSEWAKRGVTLLVALAVYGFGLGFLARTIGVRA